MMDERCTTALYIHRVPPDLEVVLPHSCVCSAHATPCRAISLLQNSTWQDFVIHAVLCT